MGLQFTDRQRKIYKEFISDPLGKEVSRTHDLSSEMTNMLCQITNKNDTYITEKEYLEKEYCEIMNLDLSNDLSNNLDDLVNKFNKLCLYKHILSPNEFEYVLNETENILNMEKEKNDNLIVRMNNWLDRANNFLNLCKV